MQKWSNDEMHELCEKAIEILNKRKGFQLELKTCWLFSNSAGSIFHILYFDHDLHITIELIKPGKILDPSITHGVDIVAGLKKVSNDKLKVALRLAYFMGLMCQRKKENDQW